MEKGEFELIDWIRGQFRVPDGVLGIGDDCAVMPQHEGTETLVTTDMLVEGVHFLLGDIDPYSLGWKSAAVNLSDIAGMGGKPAGTFLSCALPKNLDDAFLKGFFQGYKDISDRFDCPLLGGDTTASLDKLCINVTVLGTCEAGRALRRSAAQPGDLICVTGPLGDSAAGLRLVLESAGDTGKHPTLRENARRVPLETPYPAGKCPQGTPENALPCGILRERHYRPVPRIEEGMKLAATPGVNAMMDISDGIGSDLRHILEESGTGARVDVRSLPLSAELRTVCARRGWDPIELALDGGEDYELLFTCRPGTKVPVRHTVIGEILSAPGLRWEGTDRNYTGFHHF